MGSHGDTAVSYGRVPDGVGAARVTEYSGAARGRETVRVARGNFGLCGGWPCSQASRPCVWPGVRRRGDRLRDASRPVGQHGAAHGSRLRFSDSPAPAHAEVAEVPDGRYSSRFWPLTNLRIRPSSEDTVGIAESDADAPARAQGDRVLHYNASAQRYEIQEMRAVHLWVNSDYIFPGSFIPDQDIAAALVHELMHALGMSAHADRPAFRSRS